jgi:hypothetical protein
VVGVRGLRDAMFAALVMAESEMIVGQIVGDEKLELDLLSIGPHAATNPGQSGRRRVLAAAANRRTRWHSDDHGENEGEFASLRETLTFAGRCGRRTDGGESTPRSAACPAAAGGQGCGGKLTE